MKPRIIYYYQTFLADGLKDILYQDSPVTHIHLSAIHFGNNNKNNNKVPYIHLNDYTPDNYRFKKVWEDLEEANKLGIKIVAMVGGAGGAYGYLFSEFDTYYPILRDFLKQHSIIKGIDLDIEEVVSLENVEMLINKINEDFGGEYIISMAPVQSSLEINENGLGGFIYKDLYNTKEGQRINYFNTQFYFDYSFDSFVTILNNGYPPEKIVVGSISSQNTSNCANEIKKIAQHYPIFGGVFNWEYFDVEPSCNGWANMMKNIINRSNLDYQIISINQMNQSNTSFSQYFYSYIRETYELFLYFITSITT